MRKFQRHFDTGSIAVIAVTLVLFVAALWVKGFGHDLLIEAGVFLVSVKLIMMAYKNNIAEEALAERLDRVEKLLARIESRLGASDGVSREA
jgi:hypothetical protein